MTVTAVHDADAENDTETLTHTVSGGGYDEVAAASVAVTVEDIDTAGVSVDPTDLEVEEEDATGASYTVVLDTEPTGDVTVTVDGHTGTDLTVLPASLTFTTGDWDDAQTVTVTAAHDADAVNDVETLTHAVSGGGYDEVDAASVAVTVLDDERGVAVSKTELTVEEEDATGASYTVVLKAAPTGDVTVTVGGHSGTDLTVAPESLTFTTGDWDDAQTVTVTAAHDADAENDTETLTHTVSGGGYDEVAAASVAVTVEDIDTAGVSVDPTDLKVEEEDTTGASYTVVLDTEPTGDVTVTVDGHTGTDLTVLPASLTFTTGDWDDAQTVTVTAAHDADAVNDVETLTHAVSGGGYDEVDAASVAVTVLDDERGVAVSKTELEVEEEDATGASYTVVLKAAPTGDVTVTVGGHSGTDLTVAPESLTFTTGDWDDAQTVTVTAVHDADAENDTETLTHTVSGGGYDEVAAASVAVTVEDIDTAGVSVDPTDLKVEEEDTTGASYTVVLDTEPTGDVTVTVDGHTGTDLTVLPASLTFTTGDWDDAQTVTVTAAHDADAVNDVETLTHAVSGGGYDEVDAASVAVTVLDDERGVAVSKTELEVEEEDATGASYTVVLKAAPTGDVTVTVGGHSGTDLTVAPESLTFTTGDWDDAQTVTVTAAHDADAENDTETLTHTVSGGGYDEVAAASVAVTVEDIDTAGVSVDPTDLKVEEEDTTGASYTVVLDTEPTGDVTVTVDGHTGTDLTVLPASLTFTTGDWDDAQTVTVTAAHDADAVNDVETLTHAVSGGGYDEVDAASVAVTVLDDERGVAVSKTELEVEEEDATGASYTVVLDTEPTGDVTVTVGGHSGTDLTVAPESLTFTTGDWNTAQTVTVTAAHDADAVNDTETLTHAVSGGGYERVEAASVAVTVLDDERGVTVSEANLEVEEGDTTGASYTVVLNTAPTGDVTVTVDGHSGTDLTVLPASLTFTTGDWNTAQTVTVTAAHDADAVNDTETLTHTVSGGEYDDVVVAGVEVKVLDDERGVTVSEAKLEVEEEDATGASYTVVLDTEPTGDVTVTVGGHTGTDLEVLPASLTFTTADWDTAKTVTVTAAHDADAENDTETLTHTVSGGGYDEVDAASVAVTVLDDERGVTVSKTELTVEEEDATGASYTVVLAAEPAGDVTVTVEGHSGTDLTVLPASLTFTTGDWNTAQTVTVTAAHDADAENDTETLTHTVSGGGYDEVDAASVAVTVLDDERGVTVSEAKLEVEEGDTTGASYTVVLAAAPTGDVTVTVGGHTGTDLTVAPESLTFTTADWDDAQTVTAAHDADAVNDTETLTHTVSGGGYDEVDAASVAVTVLDDERGVTVSEAKLEVEEGDTTGASYTVVLAAAPTGDVTVTVGGHTGTDLTVAPESLTFTTADWDDAQTVTVTAARDADAENDTETLTHTVSGGGYDAVAAASVSVTVNDIDTVEVSGAGVSVDPTELTVEEEDATGASYTVVLAAAPTGDVTVTVGGHAGTDLTVLPASLTFTTADWDDAQTVTVTAAHDADAENDTETLTHTVSGGGYDEVAAASVAVTVEDIDTAGVSGAGVSVDPTELEVEEEDATGASYTVELDTAPTGDVTVTVGGHAGTDLTVLPASLTFTTADWDDAQTVTVTAAHDADAENDTETLTHTVSGGGYDAVAAASVAVTVEDNERGVTVSKTELTVTEEDATGASYTVVLDTEPSGDVTVTVGGHSGTDLTVLPASLTFTTADWDDAQTVTVTAAHDADAENDAETVTHTVSGGGYDAVEAASVAVTVSDIDTAGVSVDPTELTVEEEDATGASYTVVLDTAPTGDVTVTVGGHSGPDLTVDPESLTFTTGDWDTAKTVTVTAGEDADAENDTETLTHTVSGGGYDAVAAASVSVTVNDIDTVEVSGAGVSVDPTELTVTEEDTTGASYTVVLDTEPTGDVTVTVGGHSGTDLTVDPESLTFTTADWDDAQTVTVTAAHDADAENDTETLTHTVSGGGYDAVAAASVAVTVEDNERGVTVSKTELTVTEEDATGASYTVVLDTEPSGDVTVTVGGHSGTDLTVLPASLTFTTADWDDAQTVTVTAAHDADAVNDTETLTHTVSGGGYDAVEAASVAVTVNDIDTAGVSVDPTELTVEEEDATGASYTVVLDTAPTGDVTVTVGGHSGTDLTVDPESLTFTTADWDDAQTVTVTAAHDADAENDTETLTHTVSGGGYDAVAAASVAVTVEDNERGVTVSETELTVEEADATGASYTVVLDTAPTGDVTVTVGGHSGTDLTVDPASLTFTTADWDDAQTVTVTAATDDDGENDAVTLTHTASGGGYDGVTGAEVSVTVRDIDRGPLRGWFADIPSEHDGAGICVVRLEFSRRIRNTLEELRDHAVAVTGGRIESAVQMNGDSRSWQLEIRPQGDNPITVTVEGGRRCTDLGAICAPDGTRLQNTLQHTIAGPVSISVADTSAREGIDESLEFPVTLDRQPSEAFTVDYATANGTATAGEDYVATAGTLTFAPEDTEKTVTVRILDDAKEEGEEVLTLHLRNASAARIEDGEAIGTITDSDSLQKAWMARFGRTVASHVVDAVADRIAGSRDSRVTIGGRSVGSGRAWHDPETNEPGWTGSDWMNESDRYDEAATMTERDLLLGSSFQMSSGGDNGAPVWTAWGRFATSSFDAEVDSVTLSGDVITGLVGTDVSQDRWMTGFAVSRATGEGPFGLTSGMESNRGTGTVESSLTGFHPYVRLRVSDRIDLWGMAGYGTGDLAIFEDGGSRVESGLDMTMGAVGAQGTLLDRLDRGGFGLFVRSDALWLRMKSEGVAGDARRGGQLAPSDAEVSRLRLTFQGSRVFKVGGGALTSSLELGVRRDSGDAETGTGVEGGAGVRFAREGFTVEGAVRTLVAHDDNDYEEWGASTSVRIDPGDLGRGLRLTLSPAWGSARSGIDRLWSTSDTQSLVPVYDASAGSRFEAELGYGLGLPYNRGALIPYTGYSRADGYGATYRLGTRWYPIRDIAVQLEGSLGEREGDKVSEHALMLRTAVRW